NIQIAEDPHRRVVAGGADHGAGGVATGATRIEAGYRRGVRHPPVEAKGVVDMVDVPVGDAEVLLDLLGRQGEDIDYAVAEAGGEAVGDIEQVLDVARLLVLPAASAGQFIWDPLDEESRVVPAAVVLERRVG